MQNSEEEKSLLYQKLSEFFERQTKSERLTFDREIFTSLYKQFLEECPYIDWNSWKHIPKEVQRNLEDLPEFDENRKDILNRLIVVKLNGGLGTTMGLNKAKSLIEVKDGLTFLDIAVKQIQAFNEKHCSKVPLYLMNSFYTEQDTASVLKNKGYNEVMAFEQSKCPRIDASTLLPVEFENKVMDGWYPPGHSNIFKSMQFSGDLDKLIEEGRDIMFVSNIDNTCATLNLKIAQMMADENVEYAMECTKKTENDIKGGTLIDINGQLMHLEIPQVPPNHLDDFCSTRVFS
ncbi:hypothetical protein WR25_26053 [Diploscapter pachys]|uniref:UTP--glucose-1-phosphate uridylyltransferase n=1 Tax=Diploscapter pachys TaxID=2018661 RepID=A0A2A2KR13_9BILA|nr:hypothetical protein WR25_26053 [Diploscapter pachys]